MKHPRITLSPYDCARCQAPIPEARRRIHARYCSQSCARARERERKQALRPPVNPTTLRCLRCDDPIPPERLRRRSLYCTKACYRLGVHTALRTERAYPLASSKGTTGAISELRVAADLLSRGYEVFRALSPACSCDLAILVHHQIYRVEVKTGSIHPRTGTVSFATTPIRAEILAVATREAIFYTPALPPIALDPPA
jgi:hypothetical protein